MDIHGSPGNKPYGMGLAIDSARFADRLRSRRHGGAGGLREDRGPALPEPGPRRRAGVTVGLQLLQDHAHLGQEQLLSAHKTRSDPDPTQGALSPTPCTFHAVYC